MLKSLSAPLADKRPFKKSPCADFSKFSPLATSSGRSLSLSSSIKIISDPNSSKESLLKAKETILANRLTKPKFIKACLDAHIEPFDLKNSDLGCELLGDLIPARTLAHAWGLVTENLPYIKTTVRAFNSYGDYEDFLPISLQAALYYISDYGPFSSYLRQHLIRAVSDSDYNLVRRPKKIRAALHKIGCALASDPHRSAEEISDVTGICTKKLSRFFNYVDWHYVPFDCVDTDLASDTNLLRTNDFRINPSNLPHLLDSLSSFQKTSILAFYFEGKTLVQIAAQRGCTKQAVDQAIDRGLYRLYCIVTGTPVKSVPSSFQ